MPPGQNLPWFRFYVDALTNAKIQLLSETLQRRYFMLLCLRRMGEIPGASMEVMAWYLRISTSDMAETIAELERNECWRDGDIVNWDKRNPPSDSSTERVRKHRERKVTEAQRFSNGIDVDLDVDLEGDSEEEGKQATPARKKRARRSPPPTATAADPLLDEDAGSESGWNQWLADLVAKSEDSPDLVRRYVAAMERAVAAFYADRGGRFTPTRRSRVARALGMFHPDVQLVAIEIYVDRSTGLKDERYLIGIARRLAGVSDRERNSELVRHRKAMGDAGMASETEG